MTIENRKKDPQLFVTGFVKQSKHSETEMITFSFPLALFRITCIVSMPFEGSTKVPVYVKFGIDDPATHNRNQNTE
jgi:hypothetical protein